MYTEPSDTGQQQQFFRRMERVKNANSITCDRSVQDKENRRTGCHRHSAGSDGISRRDIGHHQDTTQPRNTHWLHILSA